MLLNTSAILRGTHFRGNKPYSITLFPVEQQSLSIGRKIIDTYYDELYREVEITYEYCPDRARCTELVTF